MIIFIICVSFAFTIFFVTSAVVLLRRRQQANQNVGYVINATAAQPGGISQTHFQQGSVPITQYPQGTVPITQYTQNGVPVTHYTTQNGVPVVHYPPPPSYQATAYPYQTSSQVSVQLTASPSTYPANPPAQQQTVLSENATPSAASILPSCEEKRSLQQSHVGAVETVSHI